MIVSWVADSLDTRRWATYQSRRNLPRGGAKRLGCRSGRRPQLVRGTDVMRVKGLVWLGIPADDYASAVRFFTQTLGLEMAFDEAGTTELSAANDDRIQVFGPGHRYFRFYRDRGARIVPLFEVDNLDQARAELARSGPESSASQSRMGRGRG